MWLEAIISQEDLVEVMAEFLPVKIFLDRAEVGEGEKAKDQPERSLLLHPARQVTIVPEEGIRVTCPAEITWSIIGVSPTMTIDALQVMIQPRVVEKNKGHVLEFGMKVEVADFHALPGFIDDTIANAVNAALATRGPSWNFTETLTRTVGLGKMFSPVESLKIEVQWGKTKLGADAIGLVVSFKIGFVRGD